MQHHRHFTQSYLDKRTMKNAVSNNKENGMTSENAQPGSRSFYDRLTMKTAQNGSDNNKENEKIECIQEEIHRLRSENKLKADIINNQVENAEIKRKEIVRLLEINGNLEKELEKLKEEMGEKVSEAKGARDRAVERSNELEQEVRNLRKELEKEKNEARELQNLRIELEAKVQEIEELKEKLVDENKGANEALEAKDIRIRNLELKGSEQSDKAKDLQNQIDNLNFKNLKLEKDLKEQAQEADRAKFQGAQRIKIEEENQLQEISRIKQIDDLKKKIENQNLEILKLKKDLEHQKKALDDLEQKGDRRAKEDADRLKKTQEDHVTEIQEVLRKKEQADEKIKNLEEDLKDAKADVAILTNRVNVLATSGLSNSVAKSRSSSRDDRRKRRRISSSSSSDDGHRQQSPPQFAVPQSPQVQSKRLHNQFQPVRRYMRTPEPTPTPSRENSELRDPSYTPGMSMQTVWSNRRSGGKTGRDRGTL